MQPKTSRNILATFDLGHHRRKRTSSTLFCCAFVDVDDEVDVLLSISQTLQQNMNDDKGKNLIFFTMCAGLFFRTSDTTQDRFQLVELQFRSGERLLRLTTFLFLALQLSIEFFDSYTTNKRVEGMTQRSNSTMHANLAGRAIRPQWRSSSTSRLRRAVVRARRRSMRQQRPCSPPTQPISSPKKSEHRKRSCLLRRQNRTSAARFSASTSLVFVDASSDSAAVSFCCAVCVRKRILAK